MDTVSLQGVKKTKKHMKMQFKKKTSVRSKPTDKQNVSSFKGGTFCFYFLEIYRKLLFFIKNMTYFNKLIDICVNCQQS